MSCTMSDKPFACKHDGCKETFANEDHCLVHQKRHEMVLNVGLANKNQTFADQTPTPTRFIRNCEEVGLFQDLQNVNPFEETFKKAIDNSKDSPDSLFIANNNLNISDDTLHTPHIFPHIEVSTKVANNDSGNISNSICTDLDSDSALDRSDGLIIIDDSEEEVDQIIVDINQTTLLALPQSEATSSSIETSTTSQNVSCVTNEASKNIEEKMLLKNKLRERLQTRNGGIESNNSSPTNDQCHNVENSGNEKCLPKPLSQRAQANILINTYSQSLVFQKPPRNRRCANKMATVTTNESMVSSSTEINSVDDIEEDDSEDVLVVCTKDEDRKLRNRVAQSRSRLRKKIHYDVLNGELKNLQTHTDALKFENKALRKQIHELKKYILSHHEKCAFTGDMIFLKKVLAEEGIPERHKPESPPTTAKKRKLLPALPKNTPILQPLRIQPSPNPIVVSVPPIKIPTNGNLNYIVITPPSI